MLARGTAGHKMITVGQFKNWVVDGGDWWGSAVLSKNKLYYVRYIENGS